jgi:signal transduction histidine kinase
MLKMVQKIKFEYRITAGYLIIGGLWIVFSDELLNSLIEDSETLTKLQTLKGWFYVIITAFLFYSLLKAHLEKIRQAEHKAKESDRLKTAFIQNISHEIRTPMNCIVGFSELLKDENVSSSEKSEYLGMILKGSDQLLNIVNEVLDISLIEAGNIIVNRKKVHLNDLLDDLYHLLKPDVPDGVTFTLTEGLREPLSFIYTDEVKLRQILTNLLYNSIKFTPRGHIRFGYTLSEKVLEFFIEDTGIGIDPAYHERIFERFQKAETENPKIYDGVGLGLAICKGNIDLLKGRIWLKSDLNNGSVFYFTLPYEPVNH